jgi:hypothetical protein
LTPDDARAHDAGVGLEIEDVIENYGITLDGARKFGLGIGIFIVVITAFGLIVPTFIDRLDATTLASDDSTRWLVLGAELLATVGMLIVSVVVATHVVDRWRPSPPAPDGAAARNLGLSFPFFFAILCNSIAKPTAGWPGASGLYRTSDDKSWLRVEAPAEFAYGVIATALVFTIGYAAGIVIKWGWGLYAASLAASKAEAQAERAAAKRAKANPVKTDQ